MRLLYVNCFNPAVKNDIGGTLINKRNLLLLKELYGEKCFFVYDLIYYSSAFETLRNVVCGRAGGYKHKNLKEISKIIALNNIDVVFLGFSNIGSMAKDLKNLFPQVKIIVFCHNCEFLFLSNSLNHCSVIKRISYTFNVKATLISEKNACVFSDALININTRDADDFYRLYGRRADYILPISFNDNFDEKKAILNNEDFLLFVGSDFFGNTEGLFWFIENCLSQIKYKLVVVGSGMDVYRDKYPCLNVEFLGFVEDLAYYYYNAKAVVLPVISGSGMKTKTCEALMYGKTIIGTKEAFEGYELDFDKIGKLCISADDFISAINSLYGENINRYAREIYLNKYNTSVVKCRFEKFLKEKNYL